MNKTVTWTDGSPWDDLFSMFFLVPRGSVPLPGFFLPFFWCWARSRPLSAGSWGTKPHLLFYMLPVRFPILIFFLSCMPYMEVSPAPITRSLHGNWYFFPFPQVSPPSTFFLSPPPSIQYFGPGFGTCHDHFCIPMFPPQLSHFYPFFILCPFLFLNPVVVLMFACPLPVVSMITLHDSRVLHFPCAPSPVV